MLFWSYLPLPADHPGNDVSSSTNLNFQNACQQWWHIFDLGGGRGSTIYAQALHTIVITFIKYFTVTTYFEILTITAGMA
jgi:hypothetical protein